MHEFVFAVRVMGALLIGSGAAVCSYFGLYWLIGRLVGPSLALVFFAAPISLVAAIYLAGKTAGVFWRGCDLWERRLLSSKKKSVS